MSGPAIVRLVALCVALGGCVGQPRFLQSAPEREWPRTLAAARAASDSGRWGSADRLMIDYAARHAASDEAHETLYWRGVFRVAPGNDTTIQYGAAQALESYLQRPGVAHRTEARALLDLVRTRRALERDAAGREREIAQIRSALGRAEARATEPGAQPRPVESGLAEEVTRLKAELAKSNQELERIRRRLSGTRP